MNPSELSTEAKILVCARLTRDKKDQETIAKRLNVSQATVSRFVKTAEDDLEWLVRKPWIDESKILSPITAQADRFMSFSDLAHRFLDKFPDLPLASVKVIPVEGDSFGTRIAHFASSSVDSLSQLLADNTRTVGVTWGSSLKAIVRAFSDINPPPRSRLVTCVPLCGDPLGYPNHTTSSSSLSCELDVIFNKEASNRYSLIGVPAFIPVDFDEQQRRAINQLIDRVESHHEIFAGQNPIAENLDVLLTSAGAASRALGFRGDPITRTAGIDRKLLENYVFGDVGGVLLRKPRLRKQQRKRLDRWMDSWTGVRIEHFKSTASRAAKGSLAGVILFAIGPEKAEIVFKAITQGFVNHLYVDSELGEELEKLLTAHS